MNVKEMISRLQDFDPEMEVVARLPHCCGRHNWNGRTDMVNLQGATDDAWWIPKVETVRIAGMDRPGGDFTVGREAVGIQGIYPDDEGLPYLFEKVTEEEEEAASLEWGRRMCAHRRHESDGSSDAEKGGKEKE